MTVEAPARPWARSADDVVREQGSTPDGIAAREAAGRLDLFNCRFLEGSSLTPRVLTGNRVVWISVTVLVAAQLLFVYAPFMHVWFGSGPIGLRDWGLVIALAVGVFLAVEAFKAIGRATRRG